MEDQPTDSGDLTTDQPEEPQGVADAVAPPAAEKQRRRRRFPWRRGAEQSAEEEASAEVARDEPSPEARPKRTPVGKGQRTAAVEPETEPEQEPEVEAVEPEAEVEPEVEDEPQPAFVPHRPAGKRLTYAAVGAAAVFVAAGAFAGATVQPYLADRALVDTKLQVAQTSADAITTLWTYTPDNIESLPDRAERFLSNDFATEYRTFIDSIVPSNKQAQITNMTQVVGTAVESISPTDATAIVYTNSVSTSPVTKNVPSLRYLSYRLSLTRADGDWRITQMPALTQLDLSPQL
ncbi:mammalian cell entry protein [Mycolicibacterium sp. XJ870]